MLPVIPPFPHRRGYTLLELMLVIALVAALAMMAWLGYLKYMHKGESVACAKKMMNMGAALTTYVSDKQEWPQEDILNDANGKPPEEDRLWSWWFEQLKDYGIGREDWFCPSDLRAKAKEKASEAAGEKDEPGTGALKDPTYIPGKFGPGFYAPYNFPNQPWVTERWSHDDGMNKLMPNGTIQKEFNFKALKETRGGASAPAK